MLSQKKSHHNPSTMSDSQNWTGPGTILNFVKIPSSSKITLETLEKWFDEEFVPALLATGAIKYAWLYKAASADYDKQHLIVYKVSDLALVKAGKLQEVPRTSTKGLFEGKVDDNVEFESRVYSFVQHYVTEKQDEGKSLIILSMYETR